MCSISCDSTSDSGSVRLVLIGDVHHRWSEQDVIALKYLKPDVALFVGDFGEEVVELVQTIKQQVDAHNIPAAYILGNHDAWHSLTKKDLSGAGDPRLAGTQAQLRILGQDHVGFSCKQFPAHGLSVVGARPFSAGGSSWNRAAKFNHIMFDVNNMEASAARIAETIVRQPAEHAVVVIAHNGPAGLGQQPHDICGCDWLEKAGDHGDPDLQEALVTAAHASRPAALAVFGHMHHMLKGGERRRQMVHIDAHSGTVLINCAVVPRQSEDPATQGNGNHGSLHHFTVVNMAADHYVQSASHVWVSMIGSMCHTLRHEDLVWTNCFRDGQLTRTYLSTGGVRITADCSQSNAAYGTKVVSSYHGKNASKLTQ
ncbi:hypothetical protein WJX77_010062 [Trebouxia sp. C0004]